MISKRGVAVSHRFIAAVGLLLLVSQITNGERLPIKTYTTADGLAHNNVNRIVRDSRGFLWFCTFEGLSRFDGYAFTTYGAAQGLPSQVVNDLLETRDGQYWVATEAGVCRFNPKGRPWSVARGPSSTDQNNRPTTDYGPGTPDESTFTVYSPGEDAKSKQVTAVFQDRADVIWCGTAGGLYRLEEQDGRVVFRFVELGMPHEHEADKHVTCLIEDKRGALWIGAESGIYGLLPNGRAERYDDQHGLTHNFVQSLFEDRDGHLWVGTRHGGLTILINGTPGYQCVGSFRSMEEALAKIGRDVPLVDIGLPGMSGIEGIRILRERFPSVSLLVLSVYDDDNRVFEALCAGACGYLLKHTTPARLLESLKEAISGGAPMSPAVASRVLAIFREIRPPEHADYQLTAHEKRLLKLLVEGHNFKAIAPQFGVTVHTVAFHMQRIYEKLQVHSKSEAVAKALRDRIV